MPAPVLIARRGGGFQDPTSPLLHPALSTSLSRSFGLSSPFSLSALSTSLTALSSSPGFSSMAMSLGRSFEERPKLEAQFFRNFSCCGLDLQDLHGLLEHFEECHVAFEEESGTEGGMEVEMEMDEGGSEGTISGPPSPRLHQGGPPRSVYELKKSALSNFETGSAPSSPATTAQNMEGSMEGGMEMEMDMEMEMELDEDEAPPFQLTPPHQSSSHLHSNPNSVSSSSNLNPTSPFHAPPMSAFDNPLPSLHSGIHNKKKFSTAMNPLGGSSMRSLGGMGGMMGLEALAAARAASAYSTPDSSIPGTPVMEEIPGGGVDGLFSVPPGAINGGVGVVVLNGSNSTSIIIGGVGGNGSIGLGNGNGASTSSLAPGLLFPVTPADSPPEDLGSDMEEMSRSDREEESGGSSSGRAEREEEEEEEEEGGTGEGDGSATPNGDGKAYHNLGKGVQMSPSGRPYTPPCDKPFKCSVNGCDKSYKQQNGLKYHRLHGNCNQNNVGKEGYSSRGEGKPYVCHVATCGKRYKNMNGLRYHYQHSGAHGALGLNMLAQSCHPPPLYGPNHPKSTASSRAPSPAPSTQDSRSSSPVAFGRNISGLGVGLG